MAVSTCATVIPIAMSTNIDDNNDVTAIIILLATLVTLSAFFMVVRFETVVTKEGISIKFFPFHLSFRHYLWRDISNAFIIKNLNKEKRSWGLSIVHGAVNTTYLETKD